MPGISAYIIFLDRLQYEVLGPCVADFLLSTNEIDLNMGLDLDPWKICDHITGGHKYLSTQGGEILLCFQNNHTIVLPYISTGTSLKGVYVPSGFTSVLRGYGDAKNNNIT